MRYNGVVLTFHNNGNWVTWEWGGVTWRFNALSPYEATTDSEPDGYDVDDKLRTIPAAVAWSRGYVAGRDEFSRSLESKGK